MSKLIIGFIPLTDCAPLVVAAEQGFAAEQGLELTLVRETSWANIRDRIIVGHFDAAHMLGPMVVASTLGIGHIRASLIAPCALGLGGNAITVSLPLWERMRREGAAADSHPAIHGRALKRVVEARARDGLAPLTLAMVYPFSCHNYELRYWLASAAVDPDRDLRLVVIPPPLLVDAMRTGQIDGFCVGEPWNSVAVDCGVGAIITSTAAIWPLSPEKVLGCRAQWAADHPQELAALIRALYRAALWCERPENHAPLAALLADPCYVGVAQELILRSLDGRLKLNPDSQAVHIPNFYLPARRSATFPWVSHAQWFYTQMLRWRQVQPRPGQLAEAGASYRPDLYRLALAPLGVEAPLDDIRAERFFDDTKFDPVDIESQLGEPRS